MNTILLVSTWVEATSTIHTGGDSLKLIPPIQTPKNEDWRGKGARPKTSGVTQSHVVTTVTSGMNMRPTSLQQMQENRKPSQQS